MRAGGRHHGPRGDVELRKALRCRPAAGAGLLRAGAAGAARGPLAPELRLVAGDHHRLRSHQPALHPAVPSPAGPPGAGHHPAHRPHGGGGVAAPGAAEPGAARAGRRLPGRTDRRRDVLGVRRHRRLHGPPGRRRGRHPRPQPVRPGVPLLRGGQAQPLADGRAQPRLGALPVRADRAHPRRSGPSARRRAGDVDALRAGHRCRSLASCRAGGTPPPMRTGWWPWRSRPRSGSGWSTRAGWTST